MTEKYPVSAGLKRNAYYYSFGLFGALNNEKVMALFA